MAGSDLRSAEIAAADKTLFLWGGGGVHVVQRLQVKQRDKVAKYERIDGEIVYYLCFVGRSLCCPAPWGSVSDGWRDGGAWVRSGWLDAR